jgi:signal transduction histidine kinase
VVVAMEALGEWLHDPTPDRRVWLGEMLNAIVRAAGGNGAYLDVDCPPLPPFVVQVGTIRDRPSEDRPDVTRHELHADRGDVHLGTLWLASAPEGGGLAPRGLELALEAAWARASANLTATRLAALDHATQTIASVLGLEDALQLIVDRVRALVGARYAALGTVGPDGMIERFITSGITTAQRTAIGPLPRGHGLLGLIIREGRSIRIPRISSHAASSGFPHHHPPMTSFLGVPVAVRAQPIGNFYLTDKEAAGGEFTDDDQRLVEMFALHAGIAIDNARLHEQVGQMAVIDERDRIGRDLHDGIIQSLYAVSLSLEDLPELMAEDPDNAEQRLDRAIDAIHLTIREIRNFIFGLRPESLDGDDVIGGLAGLAEEFQRSTLIDVRLDLDREVGAHVPASVGNHILQLAREAMSNAARHANAHQVSVQLRRDDGRTVLVVADDGAGFDPEVGAGRGHRGLQNMRARAEAVAGSLTVDSHPGSGTRIILALPSPPDSEGDS